MGMVDKPLITERRTGKCQSVLNCRPGETTEEAYARIIKEESESKGNGLPKRKHSHHGTEFTNLEYYLGLFSSFNAI